MKKQWRLPDFRILNAKDGSFFYFNAENMSLCEIDAPIVQLIRNIALNGFTDEALGDIYFSDLLENNIVVDGFEPITKIKTPSAFRLVLTENCNLACAECFVTKGQEHCKSMTTQTLYKVIDETITKTKSRASFYHFFGGEPLLRFDLIEQAVSRLEKAYEKGLIKKPRYGITTNGTLIDERILDFFKIHSFEVGISIDGKRETHNKLRPYKDGSGTFDDVKEKYLWMHNNGVDVHVLITPNPIFLSETVSIAEYMMDNFPMKTLTINTPFVYNSLEWSVPGRDFARILFEIMRIGKKKGVMIESAASAVIAAISNKQRRTQSCSIRGGTYMSSINPDGKFSICSQKWLENFYEDNWNQNVQKSKKCESCHARNYCGGVCPAVRLLTGKEYDVNKCVFMDAILREIVNNLDILV